MIGWVRAMIRSEPPVEIVGGYTMRTALVGSLIVMSTPAVGQASKNIRCPSENAVYFSGTREPDELRFRFALTKLGWGPPIKLVIHAPSKGFDLKLLAYMTNSGATGFVGTLPHDKLPADERRPRLMTTTSEFRRLNHLSTAGSSALA